MSAIITALSSTVITRLHLTWSHAGRKSHLDALLKYNQPSGGFAAYRALLQSIDGPCVPFVTMFLTDIVHIQDQMPDNIVTLHQQDPLIFFTKRQRWNDVISNILRYQSKPYAFAENGSTRDFIEMQLQTAGSKDQNWFWSKSQGVQHAELTHADLRKGLEAAGF